MAIVIVILCLVGLSKFEYGLYARTNLSLIKLDKLEFDQFNGLCERHPCLEVLRLAKELRAHFAHPALQLNKMRIVRRSCWL